VEKFVTALVPYRGKEGSFKYLSATDVLHANAPLDDLKGKIVLIGTTAPGLNDLRAAPVASVYPGVEIHANLIAGMLDGSIKQRPPYVLGAEVALLLFSGIGMALLLPMVNPLQATLLAVAAFGAVFAMGRRHDLYNRVASLDAGVRGRWSQRLPAESGIRFKCRVSDFALPIIGITSISITSGCSLTVNCRLITSDPTVSSWTRVGPLKYIETLAFFPKAVPSHSAPVGLQSIS